MDPPICDPEDLQPPPLKYNAELILLNQRVSSVIVDIRELRKEIHDLRSPNYQIIIAFAGLAFAIGVGIWGLAINPITNELSKFPNKDIVEERFAEAARERLILSERFKDYATKDQLNSVIIDVDRRLPRKP